MKILIAGAGIGGLTAALCLHEAGHDVQLFEQSATFSDIGAGIQCGANALKVLGYLGLQPALEAIAVSPLSAEFRDYKKGHQLHRIEFGEQYKHQYGAPYLHLHRADLHKALVDALLSKLPNCIELNAAVNGYQESDNKVAVKLVDGRVFDGDCLVAADGIKSLIRQQLLGETRPAFTGHVAWRGVLPVERLPNDFMPKVVSNFVGPDKHMVIYYLRQQQLVNFVGVVENSQWTNDSWLEKAPWQQLKDDFAGWHPTVQAVIDGMDKDQCYRWALYNHAPLDNWSSERVTLLGDAAHSTLPFMAAGAAMAIEDARVLQRALDQSTHVPSALQVYQRNRLQRTAKVQTMSTQLGKLYHLPNKALQKAAFLGLKFVGKKSEAFLPSYDANTVVLN